MSRCLSLVGLRKRLTINKTLPVADGICGLLFCAGTGTFSFVRHLVYDVVRWRGGTSRSELLVRANKLWCSWGTFASSPLALHRVMHVFRVLLLSSAKKISYLEEWMNQVGQQVHFLSHRWLFLARIPYQTPPSPHSCVDDFFSHSCILWRWTVILLVLSAVYLVDFPGRSVNLESEKTEDDHVDDFRLLILVREPNVRGLG